MAIKLGSKVRDTISGFEGIVTARHEYMYGCVRMSVTPETLHEGKPVDSQAFDEPQLVLVEAKTLAARQATGGPRDTPPQRTAPKR